MGISILFFVGLFGFLGDELIEEEVVFSCEECVVEVVDQIDGEG